MVNNKLIKDYKLSEAIKRFNQINEYTFISSPPLTEDGEDEPTNDAQQSQNGEEQMQSPNNQSLSGGAPPMEEPQQSQGGQDGIQQPMTDGGQGMNDTQQQPPQELPISGGEMNGEATMEDDISEMQPDDEVIDVDDLTDAQEQTEEKVDGVNQQLLRLLKVVSKYSDAIDQQNKEIESLKKEFEKRNPTEEERLNIRSQSGYPYSEKPKDFWNKKMKDNPNYNVMFDNEVPVNKEQEKFDIKRGDLDGMNYREIADSFDKDPQELMDYLRL